MSFPLYFCLFKAKMDKYVLMTTKGLIKTAQTFGPKAMAYAAALIKGYFTKCEKAGGAAILGKHLEIKDISSDEEDLQEIKKTPKKKQKIQSPRPVTPDRPPPLPQPNAPTRMKVEEAMLRLKEEWKDIKRNLAKSFDSNQNADYINESVAKKQEQPKDDYDDYILICRYANEIQMRLNGANSEELVTSPRPSPFALFTQKFAHVFPVCHRCATTKRWSGFSARLGERGDESFYFNSMPFSLHYCWGRELRSFVVNGLEEHT